MTCEKCLHYEVCQDAGTDFTSGAENCTFFIEEKTFITQAIETLINKLATVIVTTKTETEEERNRRLCRENFERQFGKDWH